MALYTKGETQWVNEACRSACGWISGRCHCHEEEIPHCADFLLAGRHDVKEVQDRSTDQLCTIITVRVGSSALSTTEEVLYYQHELRPIEIEAKQ